MIGEERRKLEEEQQRLRLESQKLEAERKRLEEEKINLESSRRGAQNIPDIQQSPLSGQESESPGNSMTLKGAIQNELQRRQNAKKNISFKGPAPLAPKLPNNNNNGKKTLANLKNEKHDALMAEFKRAHKKMFNSSTDDEEGEDDDDDLDKDVSLNVSSSDDSSSSSNPTVTTTDEGNSSSSSSRATPILVPQLH